MDKEGMTISLEAAHEDDAPQIVEMVNRFAAQNVMLPRTEANVRQTISDWVVAVEDEPQEGIRSVVGCGALVPLTEQLVEVRSLAVHESQHGKGLGSQLVSELVAVARERGFHQVCALTLRANFFTRMGFEQVDRWSISPKVWQACIYCSKFHRCDEVAVLMTLVTQPAMAPGITMQPAGWNRLLKWEEWQPLRLAYQREPQPVLNGKH